MTPSVLWISVMMPIFEKIHKQQYVHIRMKSDFVRKSHSQHKRIFTALVSRDAAAARSLVKKHITSVWNDFDIMIRS